MNVSNAEGKYPYGLLVLELKKEILDGLAWKYYESEVFRIDDSKIEEFDKQFEPKEKGYKYSQYLFSMTIRAFIE
jgi:putative acetyltransferase